jgi:ABC-type dipeptide/oligopeptide/nickel transport system ATPase subunit
MADQCPYCTAPVAQTRETILEVSKVYNPKDIQHLNKMLDVFNQLAPYFSQTTNEDINKLLTNSSGLAEEHWKYLVEIKNQVDTLRNKLITIKTLNSSTIRDLEKIAQEIKEYKIDFSVFSHLQSLKTQSKIQSINDSLDSVLSKAGELQGKVNQQKRNIQETIEVYSKEINDFLHYAGYRYEVSIKENTDKTFKLLLKHKDNAQTVGTVKNHLSFGERNAFALVLFMYSALKAEKDLIVLDDPVSSFDGNKQFAILNMLFMGQRCFKEKTVLVLTHEFNFVIDSIYTLSHKIQPPPKASCLQTSRDGILTELEIKKDNIKSAFDIAQKNIADSSHILCKLVHLRRLLEITASKNMGWQLVSNVLKKRDIPYYHSNEEDRPMQEDEINEGINEIHKRIPEFSLNEVMHLVTNQAELLKIYGACTNNYEKLQIYRIINNNNSSNDVIKKFVNEAFHIENDYLFQLNPYVYDSVPHYVIDECGKDLRALSEEQER